MALVEKQENQVITRVFYCWLQLWSWPQSQNVFSWNVFCHFRLFFSHWCLRLRVNFSIKFVLNVSKKRVERQRHAGTPKTEETKGSVSPCDVFNARWNANDNVTNNYAQKVLFLRSPYQITQLTGPQYDRRTLIINNKWPIHPSVIRTRCQTCCHITHDTLSCMNISVHTQGHLVRVTSSTCKCRQTHTDISSVAQMSAAVMLLLRRGRNNDRKTWATHYCLHNKAITFLVINESLLIKRWFMEAPSLMGTWDDSQLQKMGVEKGELAVVWPVLQRNLSYRASVLLVALWIMDGGEGWI